VKNRITISLALMAALICVLLPAGCSKQEPVQPVTITVWHTYVEQMNQDFETLVEDFNATVGRENQITVSVTSVANSSVLNEKLFMAANEDPGAPDRPDIAVIYPKVAVTLWRDDKLSDISQYFTEEELAAYVPAFIEEGRFSDEDGGLYLLPIAKSTEVLYLNRTMFDRFAAENPGIDIEQLGTFEGILEAAEVYREWTDAQTPDIENDGKTFYYPDGLFNWYMIGTEQLGTHLVADEQIDESTDAFARVNDTYIGEAAAGDIAIFNDYGNYLAKTGDIVCTTSTSAGAQYYPDEVTYSNNTKENVVFDVLPYPVFEGGSKVAIQRGGGLCLMRSDEEREQAAVIFMKWLTSAEQNTRFTSSAGYMPVTQEAFDNMLAGEKGESDNENVSKMLDVVAAMQSDYTFYVPPVFDGFDEMQTAFVEETQREAETQKTLIQNP